MGIFTVKATPCKLQCWTLSYFSHNVLSSGIYRGQCVASGEVEPEKLCGVALMPHVPVFLHKSCSHFKAPPLHSCLQQSHISVAGFRSYFGISFHIVKSFLYKFIWLIFCRFFFYALREMQYFLWSNQSIIPALCHLQSSLFFSWHPHIDFTRINFFN